MCVLDVGKLTCDEIEDLKQTILRWINRRGAEPVSHETPGAIEDFAAFLREIEAELRKRSSDA
jgi:hypothetical protein